MRSNDNGSAFCADRFDEVPQVAAGLRIETVSGFIQENDPGLVDERGGNGKTLFLATAHVFVFVFGLVFQVHHFQQLACIHLPVVQSRKQIDQFKQVQAGIKTRGCN